MSEAVGSPAPHEEVMYCANHPERETLLRCNKCGKPICVECGIRHPVGVRCRECAQVRKLPIYDVSLAEYVLAGLVGLGVATVAGFAMSFLGGWWLLALFIGPVIGGFIAEVMSRTIKLKRGLGMQVLAGLCIVAGALLSRLLPFLLVSPLHVLSLILSEPGSLLMLFGGTNVIYVVFAVSGAVARLR